MEKNNEQLKVIVLDDNISYRAINNVKLIRIKSKKYNLLIMKDYLPVIGEIEGTVSIDADRNITYENIRGIYTLSHNIFYLLIREKGVV